MLLRTDESTLIMQIRIYVNTCQTVCLQHQTWPSSKLLYPVQQKKHLFQVFPSTYVLFHNTLKALINRVCISIARNGF